MYQQFNSAVGELLMRIQVSFGEKASPKVPPVPDSSLISRYLAANSTPSSPSQNTVLVLSTWLSLYHLWCKQIFQSGYRSSPPAVSCTAHLFSSSPSFDMPTITLFSLPVVRSWQIINLGINYICTNGNSSFCENSQISSTTMLRKEYAYASHLPSGTQELGKRWIQIFLHGATYNNSGGKVGELFPNFAQFLVRFSFRAPLIALHWIWREINTDTMEDRVLYL